MNRIVELKQQGKSLRQIAKELRIPHTTVQYKLRKLTATVQTVQREPVQIVQSVQDEIVRGVQDSAVQIVQASIPKLGVVYKRTDPEVAPYLHLFPEDVETFSFHVSGSPPLGARDFRKVIAQKGIDSTKWEDVYFVPEGYVWPSGTKPEMIGASHYNPTNWDNRNQEIWILYQEGKNQREIAKILGLKDEVIYKRLRKIIEDVEGSNQ